MAKKKKKKVTKKVAKKVKKKSASKKKKVSKKTSKKTTTKKKASKKATKKTKKSAKKKVSKKSTKKASKKATKKTKKTAAKKLAKATTKKSAAKSTQKKSAQKVSARTTRVTANKSSPAKPVSKAASGLGVGAMAPDFSVQTDEGVQVSLKDFRGQKVILYFYPKDSTPGCTVQACGFRDSYAKVKSNNAVVLGVSPDGVASHQRFKQNQKLPFTLLVDEDKSLAKKFGVWGEKSLYGRKFMGILRSHFVIDEQGKIIEAAVKVSPKDSVELALSKISE